MKITIHNSFTGMPCAETELSRRISIAAQNLGWDVVEASSFIEIQNFKPDFVLVMHFNTPKQWEFPTYGCMWNPPVFFDNYISLIGELENYTEKKRDTMRYANVLSYDGYLSSSQKVDDWLHLHLNSTAKQFFIAPFFTSTNQTEYIAPSIQEPNLVYIGTNWDGTRFKQLFKELDDKSFMEVYGVASKWKYLKKAHKGTLPFDGVSVLNTLRQAGVGLCLHKPEHCEAETPSMRIFETVASGALAICGEHRFIKEAFGDSVLYLDTEASISNQVQQISDHIDWIKANQKEALEMSKKAHDIFLENYTLEKLLLRIVPYHQDLIKNKGFIRVDTNQQLPQKQVEIIVRVGDRKLNMIQRCLDSIVNQTYENIAVILVKYRETEGLSDLIQKYTQLIKIKTVNSEYTRFRSTQLKDGIDAITADYFAILDDDLIHPNHIYLLVSLLEKYKFADLAYSGSTNTSENNNRLMPTYRDLAYFEDFDLKKIAKFKNYVTSNSFVARSTLVSNIYKEDPQLIVAEDFFIILSLCRKSLFIFSYEVTCEFYWKINSRDNNTFNYDIQIDANIGKVTARVLKQVTNQLLKIFENEDFIYVANEKDNSYLNNDIQTKNIKFSDLRYSKPEKLLGAAKDNNSYSLYSILRTIYLKLSKGGNYNKNPNFFSKFLIYLKNLT